MDSFNESMFESQKRSNNSKTHNYGVRDFLEKPRFGTASSSVACTSFMGPGGKSKRDLKSKEHDKVVTAKSTKEGSIDIGYPVEQSPNKGFYRL